MSMLYPSPPDIELPPHSGPELVVLRETVPADVCIEARRLYKPVMTKGGERHWLNPADGLPDLCTWIGQILAEVGPVYGDTRRRVDEAFMICLRVGQGLRRHADNEFEGVKLAAVDGLVDRVTFSAMLYLSDARDYEGGELRVDGHPSIRPRLGDVIIFRGDVWHEVTTVTAGLRYAAKVIVVEPAHVDRSDIVYD